jgi:hypothetical protein
MNPATALALVHSLIKLLEHKGLLGEVDLTAILHEAKRLVADVEQSELRHVEGVLLTLPFANSDNPFARATAHDAAHLELVAPVDKSNFIS